MHEEVTQLEQEIVLKHDKIGILERDVLLKDEHLLSKKKRIHELEGRSMQKVELKGLEDDSAINWMVKNCNARALRQHSKQEANN